MDKKLALHNFVQQKPTSTVFFLHFDLRKEFRPFSLFVERPRAHCCVYRLHQAQFEITRKLQTATLPTELHLRGGFIPKQAGQPQRKRWICSEGSRRDISRIAWRSLHSFRFRKIETSAWRNVPVGTRRYCTVGRRAYVACHTDTLVPTCYLQQRSSRAGIRGSVTSSMSSDTHTQHSIHTAGLPTHQQQSLPEAIRENNNNLKQV